MGVALDVVVKKSQKETKNPTIFCLVFPPLPKYKSYLKWRKKNDPCIYMYL